MEVQLNIVKDVLFKKVQELQTKNMKEKAIVSEIEGTRSSLKHLNYQLHKLDFETLKQQEIMYNQVDVIFMDIFHIDIIVMIVKYPKKKQRFLTLLDKQMTYHVRPLVG